MKTIIYWNCLDRIKLKFKNFKINCQTDAFLKITIKSMDHMAFFHDTGCTKIADLV